MLLLPALLFYIKKIWPVQLMVIIFGSVQFLNKKVTKTGSETGANLPVSVLFSYFGEKTGLTRFFPVWLGFSWFDSVSYGVF